MREVLQLQRRGEQNELLDRFERPGRPLTTWMYGCRWILRSYTASRYSISDRVDFAKQRRAGHAPPVLRYCTLRARPKGVLLGGVEGRSPRRKFPYLSLFTQEIAYFKWQFVSDGAHHRCHTLHTHIDVIRNQGCTNGPWCMAARTT
jgi:hypothetical protein